MPLQSSNDTLRVVVSFKLKLYLSAMQAINERFEKCVTSASRGKVNRWLREPLRYADGLMQRYFFNQFFGQTTVRNCKLFTGDAFTVHLPSGLDIYLTRIKPHPSEVRLVRFLINSYRGKKALALDCGAHLGYYSVVMAHLFNKVVSFEPSPETAEYTAANLAPFDNVKFEAKAVSDRDGNIEFHVLPALYSEYNSANDASISPELADLVSSLSLPAVTLDAYCEEKNIRPDFIKVDIEGGERALIAGARNVLSSTDLVLAIELRVERYGELYEPVVRDMLKLGYRSYAISRNGEKLPIDDPLETMRQQRADSDNFLFERR